MSRKQTIFRSIMVTALLLGLIFSSSTVWAAQQTITAWCIADDTVSKFEAVIALFEQQNPNIKVDLQAQAGGQAGVMEKLAIAIVSGSAPDIAWLEGSGVIEFAAQGMLMDLTEVARGLQFTPADTQEMTYNGKLWAIPYQTAVRGLFKRADYFEQAGLNPNADPRSLEEMYDWHTKLTIRTPDGRYTRAGMVPWRGNWGASGWIWTFGGQLIETVGTSIRPTATHPKNIEAFAWLAEWAQFYNGVLDPVKAGHAGFLGGTVAMSTESSSSVDIYINANVPFAVSRVPNPAGGQNGTWGGGLAVGVPIGAKNPDLGFKLARFFGETATQIHRFEQVPAGLPANWQALLTVGRKLPAQYGRLLDQFPEARARTPLWLTYYSQGLNPAMHAVVTGTKTPEQALTDVQRMVEHRFAEIFGE